MEGLANPQPVPHPVQVWKASASPSPRAGMEGPAHSIRDPHGNPATDQNTQAANPYLAGGGAEGCGGGGGGERRGQHVVMRKRRPL